MLHLPVFFFNFSCFFKKKIVNITSRRNEDINIPPGASLFFQVGIISNLCIFHSFHLHSNTD